MQLVSMLGKVVLPAALVLGTGVGALGAASRKRPLDSFQSQVLPVLQKRCFSCHSHGGKIQGGLALDSRSGWSRGGEHGPAIVPGDVKGSLLLRAVRHEATPRMPPDGRLPAAEIAVLEQWVRDGAADPRTAGEVASPEQRARSFWSFRPVRPPQAPPVRDRTWPLDPVDRFVLSELERRGLRPVEDADRYSWLRRVHLDLTGVPPTVDELQSFVEDRSPDAHARVVDRLLGTRAYAERWARHWLDLTGYADQIGTSNNVFAEHAWRYRDYLIESFAADKPFDRFVREQIAGDLLPANSPEERASQLTATGFLVLGDVEIVNPDKLKMETDLIDQQVGKIGLAFMGQTLSCARCHDHKFDPISRDDYYAMAGMFRSTVSSHKIPYGIWSGIHLNELPETEIQQQERRRREDAHLVRSKEWKSEQTRLQEERTALGRAAEGAGEAGKKRRDEIDARLRVLARDLEHAEFFKPVPPRAFGVSDAATPGDMKICIRGNPYARGPRVPRGVPRVLGWVPFPPIPAGSSGRLQFAEWLVNPNHPLTARVAVNRIWQKLFGEGLVRSVDYFGLRSDPCSHPALLDHLATRFVAAGWSQKRLLRQLLLSRTYRMASEGRVPIAGRDPRRVDPENRLLWRMNRQRLDAEALRDSLLAVSGELKPCSGGPAMPLEYVENTGLLQPTGVNPPTFQLVKFRPEQEYQRTLYLPIVRASQPAPTRIRDVFDFTQPAQWAGKRSQTVVPTQALFLLNSDLVRKRATALATALVGEPGGRTERLEKLWLRVLNRPITGAERQDAERFLNEAPSQDVEVAPGPSAWTELCHALLSSNEFLFRR